MRLARREYGEEGRTTTAEWTSVTEDRLADYDHDHRDDMDQWGDLEPIRKPERLDVTISVRFTADEIAAVRQRALEAGLKPTVFIREAALHRHNPLDRNLLAKIAGDLRTDVERLASILTIQRSPGMSLDDRA